MPIYTYRCAQGHTWEEFRTLSTGTEVAEGSCPVCPPFEDGNGSPGFKVPSPFSAQFKGRGWTPTHYPNRKENK